MAWTWKKTGIFLVGTVGAGALCAVTGGMAAPAIGAWIGSSMLGAGLTGAAATSAGLAAIGGGALAAGGGGMAAGTAIVTAVAGGIGVAAGGTAAGFAASMLDDARRCRACNGLVDERARFCPQCGTQV